MELVLWVWHRLPRLQRWHRRAFLNRNARLLVMEATLWMILSISMYPDVMSFLDVLHAAFTGNYGSTYDSVLLISCPNEQAAQDIVKSVMEKNLAARVNILPGTTTIYNRKSKTKVRRGILIVVKTMSTIRTVEAHIRSINPCAKLEAKFFVGWYSALHEADNDIFPLKLRKA
ncbi:protein CutA homolog [Poecilia reticulata]|uniref:protein CutA homolog n=1 Tax=Poecilia reticulata TaxID=8081 RepID=UPI0004A4EE26|nr:PREDICTED: protein CutA homolog [Poecilia reticulata]